MAPLEPSKIEDTMDTGQGSQPSRDFVLCDPAQPFGEK